MKRPALCGAEDFPEAPNGRRGAMEVGPRAPRGHVEPRPPPRPNRRTFRSRNAPLGIQVTKSAGRKFIEAGEKASIDVIPLIHERVMQTEDAKEGIHSFVERRAAVFKGR